MDTKTITITRSNLWSLGPKVWFVVQDTEGNRYQRLSIEMDPTDEVLMLVKPGDKVEISTMPGRAYVGVGALNYETRDTGVTLIQTAEFVK